MRWILVVALFLVTACGPSGPRTLYVEPAPDGEWDDPAGMAQVASFTTIQDAIDAAVAGDTIEVPAGTYPETVSLIPGITIVGAGRDQTIVQGHVSINGDDNTEVRALTVDCTSATGISIDGSEYVTVQDVEVFGCSANGLWLDDITMHVTLDDLYLHNNGNFGIKLIWTEDVTMTNSLVTSNGLAGWWSQFTNSGLVAHNTFVGNGFGGPPDEPLGGVVQWEAAGEDVANNIMVGNSRGIEQQWGGGTLASNLVWGNTVDYSLDAAASASDLSVDPEFVDPTEGDYHLSPSSPAIDAGDPAWSTTIDCDGEGRPQGLAPDLGFDEYTESGFELLLTEVLANAAVESTGEFVELLNAGGVDVELAGLVLSDGDQQDALVAWDSGPTLLPPGGRAVILDSQYAGQYAIDPAAVLMTTDDTHLGNGLTTADPISLLESDAATTIATFSFPTNPGDGVSMELVDDDTGDVAGNWQASLCPGGSSPGAEPCFPEAGDPASLVITEVMANPLDEGTGEFVELWNSGAEPVSGAALVLRDGGGHEDVLQGLGGGAALIPAGAQALVVDPDFAWDYPLPPGLVLLTAPDSTLGNGLSTADTVTLLQPDGATVIDAFSFPTNPGDGVSVEKVDYAAGDEASNWEAGDASCATGHSAGRLNTAAGATCGPVLVNEVMANPLVESTGEYVELLNAGDADVELAGLVLSDGDVAEALVPFDGGPTVLAAGELAVVVDAQSDLAVPAGVVQLTTGDNTLGNALSTSDPIQLLEPDGVTLLDAWDGPFNPGNGVSVERVEALGAPNDASNWEASPCAGGGSPGLPNCATTGEAGGDSSAIELLVTEVMANPLVEATGEYVELYNDGPDPVDLAGFVLWDGDATDPLEGFVDPTDTVLDPGGWAVIIDAGYGGEYTIPADALLLTTDDSALASGLAISDPIVLLEPDGTTVVDGFSFPQNGGDGVPIERLDLAVGDVESNWAPATCGPTPGAANCP